MRVAPAIILVMMLFFLLLPLAWAATKTFRVQETEFVRIKPQAVDADNDQIIYTFSEPLDEQGEWQTGYDDAGEYPITITASDGITDTTEEILLIVENKNQPPYLEENKIVVKETQEIDLIPSVKDADGDVLSFSFQPPFDRHGRWQTDYDDEGRYLVTFTANDGEFAPELRMEVNILSTNQKPTIIRSFSGQDIVPANENEKLEFWAEVQDADNDTLAFLWELNGEVISRSSEGAFKFNYDAAGEHNLTLTISDSELQEARTWKITVNNVNRAPALVLLPLTVREGERINLSLPATDEDGDPVTYSFASPLDKQGQWQTTYEDSGEYALDVSASDGQLATDDEIKIIVLDVDRAPQLEAPLKVDAWEGELLIIPITFFDPDDDDIVIAFQNLPVGVEFDDENKTMQWTPGYDTLRRPGGFLSNVLNILRLEQFFIGKKIVLFTITACGKDLCASQPVEVKLHNVNQAPAFLNLQNITVTELETIRLQPEAADADGDLIRYYFTKPLGVRNGKWKTTIDSEGIYTTYLTAYDGQDETTVPVQITVQKKNREPSLQIRDDEVTVNENHLFSIRVAAADPDNDTLELGLKNPPAGASFIESQFLWQPGFEMVQNASRNWKDLLFRASPFFNKKLNENKKVVWLEFSASDGESETIHPVKVTVKNVNQPPQLLDYLPNDTIAVKTGQPVLFHVAVKDIDYDQLQYEWNFGFGQEEVSGTSTVRRTFLTPGAKNLRVTISDGVEKIAKEWVVNVQEEVYVQPVQPATVPIPPKFKVYVIRR